MNRFLVSLVTLAAGIALTGCSKHFDIKTAPGLVELDDQEPDYGYRAMTPEGVVTAVKVIDTNERGDLEFWTRATTIRMRELDGYALLGTSDVKTRDGTPGHELRFGHDEARKPYLYVLRVFVTKKRLFLVETGGPQAEMDRYRGALDWMQATLKVD